jgi:hypothetical protein
MIYLIVSRPGVMTTADARRCDSVLVPIQTRLQRHIGTQHHHTPLRRHGRHGAVRLECEGATRCSGAVIQFIELSETLY